MDMPRICTEYTHVRKPEREPDLDRRTRKRLATRQTISDVATRLFMARGFDQVTIDEIAEAADVGRMTVFNHFPRKEDMFFDREDAMRNLAFDTIRLRPSGMSPIQALGTLAHQIVEQPSDVFPPFEHTRTFIETAQASETLKARARQMRDDFAKDLALLLKDEAGEDEDGANAHLAAALVTATWSTAFLQAHAELRRANDAKASETIFLDTIDRGIMGTLAALEGKPLRTVK